MANNTNSTNAPKGDPGGTPGGKTPGGLNDQGLKPSPNGPANDPNVLRQMVEGAGAARASQPPAEPSTQSQPAVQPTPTLEKTDEKAGDATSTTTQQNDPTVPSQRNDADPKRRNDPTRR